MTGKAEDSMWLDWQRKAPEIYDQIYYNSNPLVAAINRSGHWLVERFFNEKDHFSSVLEVGAGTGQHLAYVRHRFDRYLMTDINGALLAQAEKLNKGRPGVQFEVADATRLPYPDASFDRLVSFYNLEHLPNPHLVLKEWRRVVKPGGNVSIAIPADGGVAWRLGRWLTTRKSFARHGLDLDYIIAREHINPAYNLISLIRHYFNERRECWYPCRVPVLDINLVYACSLTV